MKHLKDQIDSIELKVERFGLSFFLSWPLIRITLFKVASECKEAFAELQTDMTELTADMSCSSPTGIPFLSFRDYALQVIFPGQTNNPTFRDLDVSFVC